MNSRNSRMICTWHSLDLGKPSKWICQCSWPLPSCGWKSSIMKQLGGDGPRLFQRCLPRPLCSPARVRYHIYLLHLHACLYIINSKLMGLQGWYYKLKVNGVTGVTLHCCYSYKPALHGPRLGETILGTDVSWRPWDKAQLDSDASWCMGCEEANQSYFAFFALGPWATGISSEFILVPSFWAMEFTW